LLSGQVEGNVTPRTRLLIRGDIAKINSTDDESNRFKQIVDAYQLLKKQAIDQGMFIISAENFAAVTGYRPPQFQGTSEGGLSFRPSLPFVNLTGPPVVRFDRNVEGNIGTGAPAPKVEQKEDMK